jgi:peptidyl-prolyl cis-trans isomerase A (cyclophilin A)
MVTFATAGRDTRTTQVFINLGNNGQLDGMGFAPFGQVTEGMDVVKKLHAGYGEGAPQGRGPDQGTITSQGKAYLDKSFPNLDSIKSATIQAAVGK